MLCPAHYVNFFYSGEENPDKHLFEELPEKQTWHAW